MIPLGYMLKNVMAPSPDWMKSPEVVAIHSLSGCISADFGDYINLWQHNGWWLFDSPDVVRQAASSLGVSFDGFSLFYYEAFDRQFVEETKSWEIIEPEASFPTEVSRPAETRIKLSGYDVVTFFLRTSPECSPLSCNALATSLTVNERCLFDNFEAAYAAIESGAFRNSEPGPYRIIAVYSVDQ